MKKWSKRILVLAIAGVLIGGGAYSSQKSKAHKAEEPKFRTADIDRGNISQVVFANGTLQPVVSVNVGVQVSGTVAERLVDFNDRVTKGQILMRLDPAVFKARIRQAQAQLESAQASLVLARANFERNQRLQKQGFISAVAQEQSRRELDVALANVELARAQLDAAQTDLNNSVVRSPIDGVVIKRNTDVGQTVAATFQAPDLFQIAQDLKKMQIYASVSEADVGHIRAGQQVRFMVDAYQGQEFEGRVAQFRLNPATTSGIVTYTIVIDVDNPDEQLKPGMTAQTRIVVASKKDVMRIPTAALRFHPDDKDIARQGDKAAASAKAAAEDASDDGVMLASYNGKKIYRVYTMSADPKQKDKLVQHDVTIGISNTKFTELVSGSIKPGDKVVTRSLQPAGKDDD